MVVSHEKHVCWANEQGPKHRMRPCTFPMYALRDYLSPYKGPLKATIPMHLHLIWLGPVPMPAYAMQNWERWKAIMPHWTITLWTDKDLPRFPKQVQQKIDEAVKGAQKADILRYFVLEFFGGFYMDLDTTPIRPLDPLVYTDKRVWAYHDNEITWTYMCNSPIGSVAHHPIVQSACQCVLGVSLNTSDPHLHTGPKLWATCVWAYLEKIKRPSHDDTNLSDHDVGLIPCEYFSKYIPSPEKFGIHEYAATWRDDIKIDIL